ISGLPDRWFGYDAVDMIVLSTGSQEVVNGLLADDQRREALAEWVRRGGRLVISVGDHPRAGELLKKMALLAVQVGPWIERRRLDGLSTWVSPQGPRLFNAKIATLILGSGVQVLVREAPEDGDPHERPLIVQAPAGLGRVMLVGLDLDGGA